MSFERMSGHEPKAFSATSPGQVKGSTAHKERKGTFTEKGSGRRLVDALPDSVKAEIKYKTRAEYLSKYRKLVILLKKWDCAHLIDKGGNRQHMDAAQFRLLTVAISLALDSANRRDVCG